MPDDEWLADTARRGWPVLCCDSKHRKRRRPAERAALLESGVREFVLNGNVPAAENVGRVVHNLAAIVAACTRYTNGPGMPGGKSGAARDSG